MILLWLVPLKVLVSSEEPGVAFWGLSQLMVMNKYAMHGFFIQGFPKLLRFQAHHDRILKKYLPKLKKHLDKNGIDTGIYTLKWFFQCFLDRIPFSLTLRIWDLYILEGERIMTCMAYNILRMHRRYLMRLGCDELIEHLQINLEKDFGYTDDDVVNELKEALSDLGSKRMDTAGRPSDEELPKSPFGLAAQQMERLEANSGVRTGLTEKEREISANAIQRHVETEERVSRLRAQHSTLDEEDEEDEIGGSEVSLNETQSIPGGTLDTSYGAASSSHRTSAQFHNTSSGGGGDNSSSRANSRHAHSAGANSSSEAIQRLDESVRMMMTEATNINGGNGYDDDDVVTSSGKPKRYSSQSYTAAASSSSLKKKVSKKSTNNGVLSTSVQEVSRQSSSTVISKSDVVRIHVPYQPDDIVTVSNSSANVVENPHDSRSRGGAESR